LKRSKGASKIKSKGSGSRKKPAKTTSSASSKKTEKKAGKGSPARKAGSAKPRGTAKGGVSNKSAARGGKRVGSVSRAEELRSMLQARRAELLDDIRRAREASVEADRTSFPEVGDLVSASVEKERAFEYGELGVNALREIDNALEKLKEGTFGVCELCGKQIGLRRLKVMPSARLCIECKSKEEASGKKP
jgi:DnaK suppressor protein